jgi:hypothetical protein
MEKEEEDKLRKIEEDKQYLIDWQDAIDYNELFDLRKEKQAEDERIAEIEKKRLFDLEVEKKAKEIITSRKSLDDEYYDDMNNAVEYYENNDPSKQLPKISLNDVIWLIVWQYNVDYLQAKQLLIDILLNEELK